MPSFHRPGGRAVVLLVVGAVLLVGGALAYDAVPGEDYRVVVTATDIDNPENVTTREVDVYTYAELSSDAQSVFRDGRAADGEAIIVDARRWTDEFEYGTDTDGLTVVTDDETNYLVIASQEQCLGALCDIIRGLCALVSAVGAVAVAVGCRRCVDWTT
ncbi:MULTISPECIES: hypothetical protein [Haloarcula]|uniref:hypothetical protein n=1 Tax=Haloarcula TaxID=2237 RepID=UPI0023E8C122|nr:hypothetical protein [Halomicroarcula sp. SHR3]